MSDETTPQDSAAMPPASAGSHGEPVAWLIRADGWQIVSLFREHADAAADENDAEVSPLYLHPQPALTDAERAFFELHMERLVWWGHSCPVSRKELETVRGLFERLGGQQND